MPLPAFVNRCFHSLNETIQEAESSFRCPEVFYFSITPYSVFLPLFLFQLAKIKIGKQKSLEISRIAKLRLVLLFLLTSSHFIELILKHFHRESHANGYMMIYHFTAIISMMLALASILFSNIAQRRFNGFVILFSMLSLLFESSYLLMKLLERNTPSVWIIVRCGLWLFLNLLMIKKDRPTNDKNVCPYDYVGFYSILLFSWLNELIQIGYSKALTMENLFSLSFGGTSTNLREKWRESWKIELERSPDCPSVTIAIFRCLKGLPLVVIFLKMVGDAMRFIVTPIILKWLLASVSTPNVAFSFQLLCAIGLFLCLELKSLLSGYYIFAMDRSIVYIQSILLNTIFQKLLKLSPKARATFNFGFLVNLMAVDVENICEFFSTATDLVSKPIQLLFSVVMLTILMGRPALSCCAVISLIILFNVFASRMIKVYQGKKMKIKDERTKMCNEVLNGIKLIKLYAWEEAFEKKINDLRAKEVKLIKRINILISIVDAINDACPFIMAFVIFGLAILTSTSDEVLRPEIVFVALTIFYQMRRPMKTISRTFILFVQCRVSRTRVEQFLLEEEVEKAVDKSLRTHPDIAFTIKNGTFSWISSKGPTSLSNIDLSVKRKELIAIVGEVGSGKSSLLTAILGELVVVDGQITKNASFSYAPQQPWIVNSTIRKNIMFGEPFKPKFYNQVLNATELESDLASMDFRDLTEIGESGATLSGGQKARLGLARAIYQDCDVVLLDDVLSAVDVHVGKAIFEKAIGPNGILNNKTRLLVTHGMQYARECDRIIVMKDGKIHNIGTFQNLKANDRVFQKLLAESDLEKRKKDKEKESVLDNRSQHSMNLTKSNDQNGPEAAKLMQDERLLSGRVKTSVYFTYFRSISWFYLCLIICAQGCGIGFGIWRSLWLSNWTSQAKDGISNEENQSKFYGFSMVGAIEAMCLLMASISLVIGCQRSSLRLHFPLLHSILTAPMSYFDTTPIGRILNRLSKDLEVIDTRLPKTVSESVQRIAEIILSLTMICISIPAFLVVIVPFLGINYFFLSRYIATARQLKRLEGINRSLVLAKFRETIQGVICIRAFKKIDQEALSFTYLVDDLSRCQFLFYASNRWLILRLELMCNLAVLLAAIFGVVMSQIGSISPSLLGLCISYAMTISDMLFHGVRNVSELETQTVSVERIYEYSNLPSERPWRMAEQTLPKDWPSNGKIEWLDYSTKYRDNLPNILKNISITVSEKEKVAIVGRTGSGKSSLAASLYRILESTDGLISIDGIDISKIGLHDLREKLTIIPQESTLFSGSLRFNLDPFERFKDDKLWNVLEECQLKRYFSATIEKLDCQITEGGANMSMGQRQLICLGRALLRKSKILVLDEATASCDPLTDSIVQAVIRRNFADSTTLTIAHRLDTIADYEKILVLCGGQVAEFDTPLKLLADPDSQYSRLRREN